MYKRQIQDDAWALDFYYAHKDDTAAQLVNAVLTTLSLIHISCQHAADHIGHSAHGKAGTGAEQQRCQQHRQAARCV